MAFEPKTWVVEKNPLGPPADAKKATPLGSGINDLETRIKAGFDDGVYLDARRWVGYTETASDRGPQLNEALKASFESGKSLLLPPWQLTVSEPAIVESFRDVLGHLGASKIKVGNGSNCAALKSARYGAGGETGGTERMGLVGIDFDGNFAGNPGVTEPVVALDGIRPVVRDVHVKNGYENLSSEMSRAKSSGGSKLEDGIFERIGLLDSQVFNFNMQGPHDSQISCVLARTNDGINLGSFGTANAWNYCHAYGNAEYAWKAGGGHVFNNCIGEGGEKGQVIFLGDSNKWYGGWIFNGGGADGKIGFVFGDATHSAFSTLIAGVKIEGCINGPLNFVGGNANSNISGMISGASGNIAIGEPSMKLHTEGIHVTGGCVDNLNFRSKASSNTVEVPYARLVEITGMTEIKKITATYPGHRVTLLFTEPVTVKNGENLKLGANFVGSTLSLICNGTNWYPA